MARHGFVPRRARLVVPVLLALLALPLLVPGPAALARGGLQGVEKEFKSAIEKVSPATVICVPYGVEKKRAGSSSGVIVSRDGYVLSDSDVGTVLQVEGRRVTGTTLAEEVAVRVPDLERGGFSTYRAAIVKRDRKVDSSLLKILEPPPGGFPDHLPPATSSQLRIGDFNFVMGNAFGLAQEAPPTLTAGVVAAFDALPEGDVGGAYATIYTSAAVNPGVNGGPCIDIEGRLVGTVSTYLSPEKDQPYQFLGKVVPIDRVRAAYADVKEATALFSRPTDKRRRAKASAALEQVFRYAATQARPVVLGLEIVRTQPLNSVVPQGGNRQVSVPRYEGPVSGILVSADGWILTSLYNLTNTIELLAPGVTFPPAAQVVTGLAAISEVKVFLPDGGDLVAKVVAHDGLLGVALLKAELAAGQVLDPPTAAPADAYAPGRFVVALGNPYGSTRRTLPLLSVGILSKQHEADASAAWRGQWQTDAGVTDGNCGGALVDVRGRLLGMLQIWHPMQHGRNSGIGFVVPWDDVEAALPRLQEGHSRKRGFLGIQFRDGAKEPFLGTVTEASPAARAGLKAGIASWRSRGGRSRAWPRCWARCASDGRGRPCPSAWSGTASASISR